MENTNKLLEIKILLKQGKISYIEAEKIAEPYLARLNQDIIKISKKFNMKPKLVSFIGFMR